MKKIAMVIVLLFAAALPVNAQEITGIEKDINQITEQYNVDFEQLKANPFQKIWQDVKAAVKSGFRPPFNSFNRILVVIMLTSVLSNFATQQTKGVHNTVNTVAAVIVFTNFFDEYLVLSSSVSQCLFDIKNFMVSFLPVFAGVSFVSGEMITSTVYTGFFLVCTVTTANFCINFIVPSVNLFLAVGVTGSISEVVKLKPLCGLYSKTVKAVMTAAVSILCFVLSLQTTITQGQDSFAIKTGKMVVTSAVPIIGTTLQGVVGSVYASMAVLKSFCGLAGIAVILNIVMPCIIKLVLGWAQCSLLMVLSEMLENKTVAQIMAVFKEITEIMLSMAALFSVMLIFSLSIMIKVAGGV